MYIRCKNCHESIWIRPGSDEASHSTRCSRCGQRYNLQISGDFEEARAGLSRRAAEFAEREEVDLPTAYSVVLGIATREEMAELQAAGKHAARRRAGRSAAADNPSPKFDPAFRPAVEAGYLTADEAYRRGTREAYVKRLVERHRLPGDLASAVTDNQLSLLEALHRRAPQEPVAIHIQPPPARSRRGLAAAAVLVLIGLTLGLRWWAADERAPAGRARVRLGTAEVFSDDAGRIVRVVGASPEDVLRTYCRSADREARLEAAGVVRGSEAAAVRIGVLHAAGGAEPALAIPIREDHVTGRWYTGDGLRPIEPASAPEGALAAVERR